MYLEKTKSIRKDHQLFVSYARNSLGCKVSSQSISRWISRTIVYTYELLGRPIPTNVTGHSTSPWEHPGRILLEYPYRTCVKQRIGSLVMSRRLLQSGYCLQAPFLVNEAFKARAPCVSMIIYCIFIVVYTLLLIMLNKHKPFSPCTYTYIYILIYSKVNVEGHRTSFTSLPHPSSISSFPLTLEYLPFIPMLVSREKFLCKFNGVIPEYTILHMGLGYKQNIYCFCLGLFRSYFWLIHI